MTDSGIEAITSELKKAGYEQTHKTVKSTEFRNSSGVVIYLRAESNINKVVLNLDPRIEYRRLINGLSQMSDVDDEFKHHSNLRCFPRRLHGGQKPIPYCWQVTVRSMGTLPRVLAELTRIGHAS